MAISRYPLDSNNINNEIISNNAKLLYVTHSKFEHDWNSIPHSHPFTELCYVKRGAGKYIIDEISYPVHENDFIIINTGISHTEKSYGNVPLEYVILGVEGLDFFFKDDSQEPLLFNCVPEYSDLIFYMNTLLTEMQKKKANYEIVCQNLLETLLISLGRRSIMAVESNPTVNAGRECQKLKQYIDANYSQDISLDTLARISHLNKYYLVHAFTKRFGCSPISYLCQIRIQASKDLLTNTDMSITEIAQSSGFSSQSYFAQCFQKHCSMSASSYRRTFRDPQKSAAKS